MAYNNFFPSNYPQYYPYQQPQYQQPQQQTQMMTPPTIRAEIVQIGSKAEAINFPVGAGQTQMMITKDDSAIYIKTAFANGQATLDEYVKKAPEPDKPMADYITREEFEQRLSELVATKKKKSEVSNEQPV